MSGAIRWPTYRQPNPRGRVAWTDRPAPRTTTRDSTLPPGRPMVQPASPAAYQMICPVLERFQAMEGGDASNGAGTGTEIDEVRGGLRAHPSGWLEPGGGGGGSGCLGAHLPALARPLRGGGHGLYDRRLGRVSRWLELFEPATGTSRPSTSTRSWWPITVKRSQGACSPWAQARGAHAWGAPAQRPRRALPGMMLHQDGSSHEWVPGRWWDLIVTMDDDIYSAFFVAEEGTVVQGVSEAIRAKGLFCSLYADRASHYWNTPEAGGKVAWRSSAELIPAYSPEARGRSACSAPCRSACPRNSGSPITDMAGANRFLKEVFLPQHNARFATPAEDQGTAFVPFTGALNDILRGTHCLKRQHGALPPGTSDPRRPPPPPLRQGQGPRPRIPRRHNGRLPWTAMSGAIPRRWPTYRQPNPRGRVTRFDATDRRPVDKWTAAPRPTTSPQGQHQLIWYINRSTQNVLDTPAVNRRAKTGPAPYLPDLETGIAVQAPFHALRAGLGLRRTQLCCRPIWILVGGPSSWRQRRRPQAVNEAQDLSEQGSWDGDLR